MEQMMCLCAANSLHIDNTDSRHHVQRSPTYLSDDPFSWSVSVCPARQTHTHLQTDTNAPCTHPSGYHLSNLPAGVTSELTLLITSEQASLAKALARIHQRASPQLVKHIKCPAARAQLVLSGVRRQSERFLRNPAHRSMVRLTRPGTGSVRAMDCGGHWREVLCTVLLHVDELPCRRHICLSSSNALTLGQNGKRHHPSVQPRSSFATTSLFHVHSVSLEFRVGVGDMVKYHIMTFHAGSRSYHNSFSCWFLPGHARY